MEKKKILFINNHFQKSDGTVRALIGLCNNLDLDRFDVTILPLYHCDMRVAKDLNPAIQVKKGFGTYFQGMNRIVSLIPPAWLYRWFAKDDYDIEIAFQCDMPTKIIAHSKRPGKVEVCWMHGYENYPQYYQNVDRVVCVSAHNADRCRAELPYEANVSCCYNLMEDEKIRTMGEEAAQCPVGDGPLLVTVGRLSPEKGFSRLVKVLSDLKTEGYPFRLMIVGGGSEEATIQTVIHSYHMEDSVFMMGKQDNPHKFTAKADLFICSSFSEGYNTACAEAAILGVPVISTDVPGAREIIRDCECGAVSTLEDESLKDEIRKVLDNPEILVQWKKTLNQTRKRFGLEARKKALNDLFSELYDLSCQKQDM